MMKSNFSVSEKLQVSGAGRRECVNIGKSSGRLCDGIRPVAKKVSFKVIYITQIQSY